MTDIAKGILADINIEPLSLNLPDEFWCRESLAIIQQAARARRCVPDYVMGSVLARIAMLTPPNIVLPALVGGVGSLNFYVGLIGPPEAAKSSAMTVAQNLLPTERIDIVDGVPAGTGEGIAQAFLGTEMELDASGKMKGATKQVNTAVLITVDEGATLTELGNRNGATLWQTLRTGWMGGALGQTNANSETRRLIRAHKYRLAVNVGWQPEHVATLLADGFSGTPQRFFYTWQNDTEAPKPKPEWPGELDWKPPDSSPIQSALKLDGRIIDEVDDLALSRLRGTSQRNVMDAHETLGRLKVSALLALLDHRTSVNMEDWRLGAMAIDTSKRVRGHVQGLAIDAKRRNDQAAINKHVQRESAVDESKELRAITSMAKSIANKAVKEGRITRREASWACASKHKKEATVDDAIDHALRMRWIKADDDGFKPDKPPK